MPIGEKIKLTPHMRREEGESWTVWVYSTANLSPPGFFLGKVRTGHMRYLVHSLDRLDGCARTRLFISQKKVVAVGKSKDTTTTKNNEQHKQGAQRPAQRGVHTTQQILQQPGMPQPAYISAPSVGCG